jgi:hypothetical protein
MTRTLFAVSAILALAACGGATSPTEPSAPAAVDAPSQSSATISGRVAGIGSAQTSSGSHGAGAGMTVSVAGTSVSSSVNSMGQFALANVPAHAAVVLRFEGAGANAQLPVGSLAAGETLNLTVAVTGSTAAIEGQTRGNGSEVEGRIESIQPGTIVVAARTVTVGASTTIRHGGTPMTFSELTVGTRVHVKGTPSGTGATATTAATEIIVQNTNADVPVNLQGTVSGLSGTAASFEMTVQGRIVKGDASTSFKGGKSPSFAGLANGAQVHVKGKQENGYVRADDDILQGK